MANVHNTLSKDNPYGNMIISLIQEYGNLADQSNPHEIWLAAALLELRTKSWGEAFSNESSLVNAAVKGAQADGSGADNPNTAVVERLKQELIAMTMSQPNGWQDWLEAIGYFYENVGPFIFYFENNYKNGVYSDFYRNNLNLFKHPEGNLKGLTLQIFDFGDITSKAKFDLSFTLADSSLHHRFFVIYDTLGFSTLFYYDVNDVGGFIPPTAIIPDSTVKIIIASSDDEAGILVATKAAIDGLTTYITIVENLSIESTSIVAGAVTDPDEGTVLIGVNFTYTDELKGSDGSVLASGITDKDDYTNKWNELKVAFEATQNNTYPYLNSRIIGIGDPVSKSNDCLNNCGVYQNNDGCAVYCPGLPGLPAFCCKACTQCAVSKSSTFRTLAYPIGTSYNTPGSIFIASEGSQANLTPVDQLI